MECDRIYIDYKDYETLNELYEDADEFISAVTSVVVNYNLDWFTPNNTLKDKVKVLAISLCSPIYDEYKTDKIAYLPQYKDNFLERMMNSIFRKINRWNVQHNMEWEYVDTACLDNFISNGSTQSSTRENASTGSAVIQKSASTPTGIEHNVSEEDIDMKLSHNAINDNTKVKIDDGYEDKYTNFVGKTNGLHRNEVDRDTLIQRKSNLGLAEEVISKIPYSFINEVLSEVSQHFIEVY